MFLFFQKFYIERGASDVRPFWSEFFHFHAVFSKKCCIMIDWQKLAALWGILDPQLKLHIWWRWNCKNHLTILICTIPVSLIVSSAVCEYVYDGEDMGHHVVPGDIPRNSTHVALYGNSIYRIENDSFAHLKDCIWIGMGDNSLGDIQPGAFNGLDNLKSLYLYENYIQEIKPGTFHGLKKLTRMSLWSNSLTTINTYTLEGLVSLEHLDLAENKISSIAAGAFSNKPNLRYLDLYWNRLTTLKPDMFTSPDDPETGTFSFCYRPQTKLWEDNVFTPVCYSIHRGGVSQHAMGHEWGVHSWVDTPSL